MATRDYYFILDVPPISSSERIRQAYRSLSKRYHPDLNPDNKYLAEVRMKELVEAYTHLIDPVKRKAYDSQPQFKVRRFRRPSRTASKPVEQRRVPLTAWQKLMRILGLGRE